MFGKKKNDDLGQNIDEETMEYHDESENIAQLLKDRQKDGFISGLLCGITIIFVLIIALTLLSRASGTSTIKEKVAKITGTDKESQLKEMVKKYYYKDVDDETLEEGSYKGLLESLNDPYSVYYTKDEYKILMQQMDGDYVGIGVMVAQDKNTKEFVVTGVIKNSPAEDAGMLEKDVIIKVDGQDVTNCDLDKLVSLVRGKKGTGVSITVTRENEEIEFQLDRAEVSEQIVYYEMLDDNIGYIELTQFSENSAEQVKDALEELESQNMEKLIFDVRDNPGGDLQQILKIAGYFIPKDEIILSYKMKDGSGEDYKNDTEGEYQDIPMVVLVNEDSASAAEAFSGCMKAYKRATIVGTNTYGKGIMQTLYQLDDGSAVKITIAKYYLPDGSNIQDVGIAPDVEVEEDENINIWDLEKRDSEPQFQKALEVIKGIS